MYKRVPAVTAVGLGISISDIFLFSVVVGAILSKLIRLRTDVRISSTVSNTWGSLPTSTWNEGESHKDDLWLIVSRHLAITRFSKISLNYGPALTVARMTY